MSQDPGFLGRCLAWVGGEVSAADLEAYRGAGRAVYDLLDDVENRRLAAKVEGKHAWTLPQADRAELLCAWNAFALQTLGDQLLEADYRANPSTVGYVPPVTAEQALAWYSQVEPWISRARQAASNPDYQPDVSLPADLPPWKEIEPCPRPHLEAMLAAAGALRTHAEAAMAVFEEESLPPDKQGALRRLRQILADATATASYAEGLSTGQVPPRLHEQIEQHLQDALARYYQLGQLLAMPELVERLDRPSQHPAAATEQPRSRRPGPGEVGFDPWCLTDPATREHWKQDAKARSAIDSLWASDPDPRRTLAVQQEIDAALGRGDIAYALNRSGVRIGQFYCCPWAPIYLAKAPVSIAGRHLGPLQQFTFDVSAEELAEGGAFRREILLGAFQPTSTIDYCDPTAGGHDED